MCPWKSSSGQIAADILTISFPALTVFNPCHIVGHFYCACSFHFMLSIFMIFSLISVSIVNIHVHKVHKSYPFGTLLCSTLPATFQTIIHVQFLRVNQLSFLIHFIQNSISRWYYALLSAYYSWEYNLT